MPFPYVTCITAGAVLILQIVLAALTSGARGKIGAGVGDGGDDGLLRAIRRHGNLAENGGIFVAGFLLLELSQFNAQLLVGLCATFVVLRVLHALGLSLRNTNNVLRLLGGAGTYLLGLGLGGTLIYVGATMAHLGRMMG